MSFRPLRFPPKNPYRSTEPLCHRLVPSNVVRISGGLTWSIYPQTSNKTFLSGASGKLYSFVSEQTHNFRRQRGKHFPPTLLVGTGLDRPRPLLARGTVDDRKVKLSSLIIASEGVTLKNYVLSGTIRSPSPVSGKDFRNIRFGDGLTQRRLRSSSYFLGWPLPPSPRLRPGSRLELDDTLEPVQWQGETRNIHVTLLPDRLDLLGLSQVVRPTCLGFFDSSKRWDVGVLERLKSSVTP